MKSKIDLFVITRIKERRMQKNISQRGLAAILDCSPSFIGQVESEKFDVKYSVHQVFLVAQFFECSPAEFFPPIDFDYRSWKIHEYFSINILYSHILNRE